MPRPREQNRKAKINEMAFNTVVEKYPKMFGMFVFSGENIKYVLF